MWRKSLDITPVVFILYFSQDRRVVKEIQERMMKALGEHIGSSHIQNEMYKNLPNYIFEKIKSFATKTDVLVELDKSAGKIEMRGFYRDLASVKDYCHEMVARKVEYDQQREKELTVATYVQWMEKQKDGSLCHYDQSLNYQIEKHYKEANDIALIQLEDAYGIHSYKLDFSNKEEMKISSENGKLEHLLIREDVASSKLRGELIKF